MQTERLALYEAALDRLKARELVYPCTCTRSDVEQAASAPHPDGGRGRLPRHLFRTARSPMRRHSAGRPFAWRFRVGDVPAFDDLVPRPASP